MRIIFLDFDGVLLTADYQRANGGGKLDPAKVRLLYTLLRDTNARVVVTSNWRGSLTKVRRDLERAGLKNVRKWVVGVTPRHCNLANRGEEIEAWLEVAFGEVEGMCILDDDADMGRLLPWLVQTDYRVGLTQHDVTRAGSLLEVPR